MASALDGFFSAQRSALDSQDRFQETRARNMAGKKLATRDYAGAASELYSGGQIEAGADVQNFGAAQESNARKVNAEQVKERASLLMQVSKGLKEVPAGQRKAQLDRISPVFQKVGLDATMFGQLTEQDLTDEALDVFAGSVAKEVEFIKSSDGSYTAASKATGLPQFQYRAPRPDEFKEVDPTKDLVRIPGSSGAASAPAMGGASGGFEAAIGPLLQREGGFVAKDGRSGAPANFGINQKFNPDIDVKNLTADQAKQLYKTRYWDAINADQLPPDAQAAVFDAAVNQGPETAVKMWQESGQNVQRFNQLRLERYRQTPGYAESGRSWERRVAETGGSAPASTPEVVRAGKPKPDWQTLSDEEAKARGLPADGTYQLGPNGQVNAIQQPRNNEKPTEGAKRNVALTYRMLSANDRLNAIIDSGITKPSYWKLVAEGGTSKLELRSERDRRFVGAAKEWLSPILRKDTGAAVTDQEFLFYADTYIPAPGDTPPVLRQKAEARQAAMIAMAQEAGPLYTRTHGRKEFKSNWAPTRKGSAPTAPTRGVKAPQPAIQALKSDPSPLRQKQFDEVFGQGAARAALGGK